MKMPILPFVLAGTALAQGLLAHDDPVKHENLLFEKVATTYVFKGGVAIECITSENVTASGSDTSVYEITLKQPMPGTELPAYSLLSLGLQSVEHTLELSVVSGKADIALAPTFAWSQLKPLTKVLKTGTKPLDQTAVDDTKIGFLRFSGTSCKLKVVAVGRQLVGTTYWYRAGNPPAVGHDNNPPPLPPH